MGDTVWPLGNSACQIGEDIKIEDILQSTVFAIVLRVC